MTPKQRQGSGEADTAALSDAGPAAFEGAAEDAVARVTGELGCVVIGRNEGERLRSCLESIREFAARSIYVDSGSQDGSEDLARSLGFRVLALDPSRPFTAARARNEGFRELRARVPGVEFAQFIDGDCTVHPQWLERGARHLADTPDLAVVVGRSTERNREASVYNRLADIEWQVPVGSISACGGVALMRATAVEQVGGFREDLIAGEEPELSLRLLESGWRLECIDAAMMTHDLAMFSIKQWWERSRRCGFAYASGNHLHPGFRRREILRLLVWGGLLPASILASAWFTSGLSLLLLLAYLLPARGAMRYAFRCGHSWEDARLYAYWTTLSKIPGFLGVLGFWTNLLLGRQGRLIEHK